MEWDGIEEMGGGGVTSTPLPFHPPPPSSHTRALPQPFTPALSRKFGWEAGKQAVRKFSLWSIFNVCGCQCNYQEMTPASMWKGFQQICLGESNLQENKEQNTWRHMIDSDAQMLVLHSCSNELRSNDFSASWLRSNRWKRQGKMIPSMCSKSAPPSLNCLILETCWVRYYIRCHARQYHA